MHAGDGTTKAAAGYWSDAWKAHLLNEGSGAHQETAKHSQLTGQAAGYGLPTLIVRQP